MDRFRSSERGLGSSTAAHEPSRRNFLKISALTLASGELAGLETKAPAEEPENEQQQNPEIDFVKDLPPVFKNAIETSGAKGLLNRPEFKKNPSFKNLNRLFRSCDKPSPDASRELAVAAQFFHVLKEYSSTYKWSSKDEYPNNPEELKRFYAQGGFVAFKSLEKYLRQALGKGELTEQQQQEFIQGFEQARKFFDFLTTALNLDREKETGPKLQTKLGGVFKANESLMALSYLVEQTHSEKDVIFAAKLRKVVGKNIEDVASIEREAYIYIDRGTFVFPDPKTLKSVSKGFFAAGFAESGRSIERNDGKGFAGVVYHTQKIVGYLNTSLRKDKKLGADDEMLANMLLAQSCIKFHKGVFEAKPEVPQIMFCTGPSYIHEKQHFEFDRRPDLIRYWVEEWNKLSAEKRRKNIVEVADYGNLPEEQKKNLSEQSFTFEQIQRAINTSRKGDKKDTDVVRYEILQEFFAYSTDNLAGEIFDPKREVF